MEIKIKAAEVMGRVNETDKIDLKSHKEYVAINEATQKMYNQAEKLMPIIINDEQLPADYTFEVDVVRAVNDAGYFIKVDKKLNALFLTIW